MKSGVSTKIDFDEKIDSALKAGDRFERELRWGKPSKRPPSKLYKDNYEKINWSQDREVLWQK